MLATPDATPAQAPRRQLIDKCPYCGSRLLIVEGVTHYVSEVEIDEDGGIHEVRFADLNQVPYHKTTWLECDENCSDSNEYTLELAIFDEGEDD